MIQDAAMARGAYAGSRCHDQRRFWSSAVTRAFTSLIRTSSLGSQSEVSRPDEVVLRESHVHTLEMPSSL